MSEKQRCSKEWKEECDRRYIEGRRESLEAYERACERLLKQYEKGEITLDEYKLRKEGASYETGLKWTADG